jgi:hypothetical protein
MVSAQRNKVIRGKPHLSISETLRKSCEASGIQLPSEESGYFPEEALTEDPNFVYSGEHREYLASNLWRRIRLRVLKRDGRICFRCGGPGNVVHHRSYAYDVRNGDNVAPLATVCEDCHETIHFLPDGSKRPQEDVKCSKSVTPLAAACHR